MTKEDIIVLCEEAIDRIEEGGELDSKAIFELLHEVRAYLVNQGD